jgi:molybdopterin synthase sulfur carrier subunit
VRVLATLPPTSPPACLHALSPRSEVLRKHTGGEAKVSAEGATVGEVFTDLTAAHPGLEESLFDGGKIRGFINVYVEDEDVRYLDGLDSAVEPDSEIAIMPAVAGGAGA